VRPHGLDRLDELERRARALAAAPAEPGDPLAWLGPDADAPGLSRLVDHTLLRPDATRDDLLRHCDEAAALGVRAACVHGGWVATCAERLRGTGVLVAAVVGFPHGGGAPEAKAAEAALAVEAGARELDVVMPLGRARGGEWAAVADDVRAVVAAAGPAAVKVIVESGALERWETALAALVALEAGAAFVKTSTGFHPAGGATVEAVSLLRQAVGPAVGVKASGGIRTAEAALAMVAAGANRLGTSSAAGLGSLLGAAAPPLAELVRGRRDARRLLNS
jgi:deoxyribose-phosphate aldolase